MNIKKIIIDMIVILSAFILFIAWYRYYTMDHVQRSASLMKYNKIYLITTDDKYQYWQCINQGASDMAKVIGVNYIWTAPAERSATKQIEIINKVVDDGANALLVAADDPKRISGAIEDAKARGVKIIYVDSPANEEANTTLATDNYKAGMIAGQTILSELEKRSIEHGSIGIISVKAKQNTDQRDEGFRKVIKDDERFTLLDTILTNGEPVDAKLEADRLIGENKDLVGLFGTNEGTSEGVGYAIAADNNRIVGIGFDKTDAMMKLLRDGSLRAIMLQNPYTMGYLGISEAVAALMGKDTGPFFINTGITVLTGELSE